MKKLCSFLLASVSILSITTSTQAYAQAMCCSTGCGSSRAGTATFTLGSGYAFFSPKRHLENTDIPFVAAGYNFTNQWGIEGYLGIFNTTFKKSVIDRRQVKGTLFAVDGVYHFSPYQFIEPFILAGVGITGLNPNGTDAYNQGNVNVGLGTNIFINKVVAFRLEARDFYATVSRKNDVLLNGGVSFFLDLC